MTTTVLPIVGQAGEQVSFVEACNRHLFLPNDNKIVEMKRLLPSDKAALRAQFRQEFGYVLVNGDGVVVTD